MVVDYIGIKKQMNLALAHYSKADSSNIEEIEASIIVVRDHLDLLARIFHQFDTTPYFSGSPVEQLQCLNQAAEFVQLTEKADSKVDPLSGGQKRRVSIARSLINEPDLLLLDEPTTGLDPQARHVLWDRLYQLKERGATQVITTHFMDEAEQLCDRLVVMDAGKIVAEGSPQGLISKHVRREVLEVRFGYGLNESMVPKVDGVGDRIEILPDRLLLYSDDGDAALSELHRREIIPESALVRRSSLEDVFLKLTGRTLVE